MESILAIWKRDIIGFFRDKASFIGSLAMPFMLLIIFGSGMGGAIEAMMGGNAASGPLKDFNFIKFMFPGVIAMTVFTTAIISALSVVQDREVGYLREILVSPISRFSVTIGKILGGSTIATIQGLLMLIFVPLMGIKISFPMVIKLALAMFIVAFAISALGLFVSSFVKTSQGFHAVIILFMIPMLFLSGTMFPTNGIPAWMNFLVKINPLTYAVDMFRKILLQADTMNPMLRQVMGLNLTVFNHSITILNEILFIILFGLIFAALASVIFNRGEAN